MRRETRILPSTLCVLAAAAASGTIEAQPAYKAAEPWSPPLTADGQPDIGGDWTNDTYTPLERPAELANKEFFTREEALAFVKSRTDRLNAQ
ncbi:MAG TPA: hypothetical protein VFO94_10235, partial [Gammaproteobacteria bacterium]|nr:hypothetical protein [Gammaproteobacteria bacterium]